MSDQYDVIITVKPVEPPAWTTDPAFVKYLQEVFDRTTELPLGLYTDGTIPVFIEKVTKWQAEELESIRKQWRDDQAVIDEDMVRVIVGWCDHYVSDPRKVGEVLTALLHGFDTHTVQVFQRVAV